MFWFLCESFCQNSILPPSCPGSKLFSRFPARFKAPPIQTIFLIFASISGAFSNATATVVKGPVTINVTGSRADGNTPTIKSCPV